MCASMTSPYRGIMIRTNRYHMWWFDGISIEVMHHGQTRRSVNMGNHQNLVHQHGCGYLMVSNVLDRRL